MTHVLSIPIAFVAGIISFLSPCVLPLVPGYVSMLSGASIEELRVEASGQLLAQVLRNSLAFVAGFTLVFVNKLAIISGYFSFLNRFSL
jgi:cytochrome c-type biogenesis protein